MQLSRFSGDKISAVFQSISYHMYRWQSFCYQGMFVRNSHIC